jgi:hypothetical protein
MRREERLAMRNAVASKPRASLDGTPRASRGPSVDGKGAENFRSFFSALDIDGSP